MVNQSPDLKQYARNYLFQIDDLVRNLYDLKYKLTEVLFTIETEACHCHSVLDKGDIPLATLKKLPSSYSKGFFFLEGIIIDLLKRKKILSAHYKNYSDALEKIEVAHG